MRSEHAITTAAGAKFYVYGHFRADDGKCFYIGKGKAKRAWKTWGRSQFWKNVANKHGYRVQILATWESEEEAFEHEKLLIACFRDMGHPLVNLTDGGEGLSGLKHSAGTRAKMAERAKQRLASPEARAVLAERNRQRWADLEAHVVQAERAKQRLASPEAREALAESSRRYWSNPESRATMSERAKQRWADPEARATMSERAKQRWADLEAHMAQAERMSGESSPAAKLPDDTCRQIFHLRAEGLSQRKIAAQIGCSFQQVSNILSGKQRRNIYLEFHPEER